MNGIKTDERKTSVIVSLFNYEDSIDELKSSLAAAMESTGEAFELVFVDDGSTDATFAKLDALAKADARIRVIRMRSTFGEASGLDAGLKHSTGDRIIFLSGRVRVSPKDLPAFLAALNDGDELVVGWRHPRKDGLLNGLVSRVFNGMVNKTSKMRLHDINSGVIVTYRYVLEGLAFYGDLYNFIPVLAHQQGYRVSELKIEQLTGRFRKSKYPNEYLRRLLDIVTVFFLTRYSKKPIHFLGFMGTLLFLVGAVIEIYLFMYRILGMGPIAGRPLLILGALLLVIGIQMISIGLLGEMIIFTHAGDIEEYNIKEIIN